MDLLSQLVGTSTCKQSSDETDQEETDLTVTANVDSNKGERLKMIESDVNRMDVNKAKSNIVCKMEETNLENGDSPKFGIVESFMLKMTPDSGVQIFRSKKGFEKLAYEGFLYNLDKRHQKYILWRCEMSKKPGYKCSGRVRMTEDSLDMYSAHSHPPNPLKVVADILKARLYAAAEDPTNSSKFLYHEAVHLASFAGSSGLPKLGSMQRVISRKRRHTQKLLEESSNPTSSGYDSSNVASTSVSSDGNCSISDLFQTAERLQFLFTPSGGFKEIGLKKAKDMGAEDDINESSNMKKSRTGMDDRKIDLSTFQSLFADAGISDEKTECPFKPSRSKRMEIQIHLQRVAQDIGISDLTSFDLAEALDDADPLKFLRNEFAYPKMRTLPHVDLLLVNANDDAIYMCGNSLGLMPKGTKRLMDEQFEKWANMGVFGHLQEPLAWAQSDEAVLGSIAELVGAQRTEVALMNSLTVNLHILLAAFYKPTLKRHKIFIESKAFPSDHYAVESQIRLKGFTVEESLICMQPRAGDDCIRNDDIIALIEEQGDAIAIIWFSAIHYYTGQLFDIRKITKAGHDKGCLVGWNLAHAFANIPLSLHEWDVDFACWCTYKYSCSGAGGIGGFFVHKRFETDQRERMVGWWGHKKETRFIMDNQLDLESGAAGYRISNPPMMLIVPLIAFLEVISKTTMQDLRAKSMLLTGYLEYLINHFLSPSSLNRRTKKVMCTIMTPSDPEQRGCQLSLKFNVDISLVYEELVKRGVAVDKRYPDVIRVTPVHLYNSYTDVHRFMRALLDSLIVVEGYREK
ncbi:kynureninase [Loa loa]|uniref:Kynureninase n=1 Tax=Loa loa TaxID=7209 RepID=A0A1I7V6F4_LOALO|nr:kynureninase [Loa loa]EJD75905.1 kynureninase [Loa loa]